MNEFELRIDVEIRQKNYSGSGIRVTESLQLSADSFLDVCSVLARFHDLAEMIRANPKVQRRG